MNKAMLVLTVLLALLSIAAGAAKVTLVPDEVDFLSRFGFSQTAILFNGGFQIVGGILMVVPASAYVGATMVLLAFTLSTTLLVLDGNIAFALVSAVPIALTTFILLYRLRQRSKPGIEDV